MPIDVVNGPTPLILALPYSGAQMPRVIQQRLSDQGRALGDTDSYLERLFLDLTDQVTLVRANFHRYLGDVDACEQFDKTTPAKGMMGVVPTLTGTGHAIWDTPPRPSEANSWRSLYNVPFHAALRAQVARVRARHGHAIVLTVKSTAADVGGTIAHFAVSSNMAASCSIKMSMGFSQQLGTSGEHSNTLNSKPPSGWITKSYGKPDRNVHALQLGVRQDCFLSHATEPNQFDPEKAAKTQVVLIKALNYLISFMPEDKMRSSRKSR